MHFNLLSIHGEVFLLTWYLQFYFWYSKLWRYPCSSASTRLWYPCYSPVTGPCAWVTKPGHGMGGGGWLMWEWGRYIFLWQWYWLCCKFKLLLEVWNTLLIFDAKHLSILCLSTSLSWISISGGWIIWFVSTQNLTQLVQLVQGRGNHFNGGGTTPYIYSIHSRVENTSRSSWERFGVVVVREVW